MYSDRYSSGAKLTTDATSLGQDYLSGLNSRPSGSGIGSSISRKDEEIKPQNVQYISPTSCLVTYHSGEVTSAVEDHFNRSLNLSTQYGKGKFFWPDICVDLSRLEFPKIGRFHFGHVHF